MWWKCQMSFGNCVKRSKIKVLLGCIYKEIGVKYWKLVHYCFNLVFFGNSVWFIFPCYMINMVCLWYSSGDAISLFHAVYLTNCYYLPHLMGWQMEVKLELVLGSSCYLYLLIVKIYLYKKVEFRLSSCCTNH